MIELSEFVVFDYGLSETQDGLRCRAATFTRVNGIVSCFCNKRLKIGLPFTQTLPCDQCRGLLIAFSNEHPALDHQSVCLFSQIRLYLIKYQLQLELLGHAQLTVSYDSSVPQWPSDISGNDWCGPVNSSPAADRMSDENFGANPVFFWAEI